MSKRELEGAAVVPQGIRLILQSEQCTRSSALDCQWINYSESVKIPKRQEELISSEDDPDFPHIALTQMTSSLDITAAVKEYESNKARGVVLINVLDNLPSAGDPRLVLPSDIAIPVVLIKKSPGLQLLDDLSSTKIMVKLTKESAVDARLPEYFGERAKQIASERTTGEHSVRTQLDSSFHLSLRNLLYDGNGGLCIIHKDLVKMWKIFQLIDDFENKCTEPDTSASSRKREVKKVAKELKECAEASYSADFPFHALVAWRLYCNEHNRAIKEVMNYFFFCSSLPNIDRGALETTLLPFLSLGVKLPWNGRPVTAPEALCYFFCHLHRCWPSEMQKKRLNSHPEELRVPLISALLFLAIREKLEKAQIPRFWRDFVKRIAAALQLPVRDDIFQIVKLALQQGSCLGISEKHAFGPPALVEMIQEFKISDLNMLSKIIIDFFPLTSLNEMSWLCLSTGLREIIFGFHKSLFKGKTPPDELGKFLSALSAAFLPKVDAKGDFNSEMSKWIYNIIPAFDIHCGKWPQLIAAFRKNSPEGLKKLISLIVNKWLPSQFSVMEVDVFVEIITVLRLVRKEVVGEYIRNYTSHVKLAAKSWKNLFRVILDRAWALKPEILAFLKSAADFVIISPTEDACYRFFLELLVISHPSCLPNLLTFVEDVGNDEESDESGQNGFLDDLHSFLINYFHRSSGAVELKRNVANFLSRLGEPGRSPLRDTILSVFFEVALPSKEELIITTWSDETVTFTKVVAEMLIEIWANSGGGPLPDSSFQSVTCWKLLVRMCSCLLATSLTLTGAPTMFHLVRVFKIYWPPEVNKDRSKVTFSKVVEDVLTNEMNAYRKWFFSVRKWLESQSSRFLDDEMTVKEIGAYAENYKRVAQLHENFCCNSVITSMHDLTKKKHDLLTMRKALAKSLYCKVPSASVWKNVVHVLIQWKVLVDATVLDSIRSLLLNENLYGVELHDSPGLVLSFTPPTTFRQARKVCDVVSRELKCLTECKDMLCYFAAKDSVLFRAYMDKELASANCPLAAQQLTVTQVRTKASLLPLSFRPLRVLQMGMVGSPYSSEDLDDDNSEEVNKRNSQSGCSSLETFVLALKATKKSLEDLLGNKARFNEVSVLGQDCFKGVDVEAEFDKVAQFPEFEGQFDVTQVQGAIKDMLQLMQYRDLIATISDVCEQYQMKGCLEDKMFQELQAKRKAVLDDTSQVDKMTTGQCSSLKQDFDNLLCHVSKDRLHLFDAVNESEEFFKFIKNGKFYTLSGRDSFKQQVGLITNQLRDQEYDETVLNHLMVAFPCVAPFTDPTVSFEILLNSLKEPESFRIQNWLGPITTVNNNITLIKFWFSKAQGDTLKSVSRDLEAIMDEGKVEFSLGQSAVFGTGSSCMELSYTIQSKETFASSRKGKQPHLTSFKSPKDDAFVAQNIQEIIKLKERQQRQSREEDFSLQLDDRSEFREVLRTMNLEELEDFVRKLGFLENDKDSVCQGRVKVFQKQVELFRNMFELSVQLFKLGHREFQGKLDPYPFNMPNLEEELEKEKRVLEIWRGQTSEFLRAHPQLLLFNMRTTFILARALVERQLQKVVQLVSRLFPYKQCIIDCLKDNVVQFVELHGSEAERGSELMFPMRNVGVFLKTLTQCPGLSNSLYPQKRQSSRFDSNFGHIVHLAYGFNLDQLLKLILKIYSGFPESYELLQCSSRTSSEEVELFLERIQQFPNMQFAFVQVEKLSVQLQEEVLRFQSNLVSKDVSNIHYILTNHAMFQEAPWLRIEKYKEGHFALSDDEVSTLFEKWIVPYGIQNPVVVYGRAGDGKSHYIRKQIPNQSCTIAVHEGFNPLLAIRKLQKLDLSEKDISIYFNFTSHPLEDAIGQGDSLMTKVHWFLFSLIVLGIVEDVETGESFRLFGNSGWRFFIEVPSLPDGNSLDAFLDRIPLLKYFGRKHEVKPTELFEVNEDVQLVCKYLRAYDTKNHRGIDRIFKGDEPVQFSSTKDLQQEECNRLLNKYMHDHIKERKVLQHLFIKYMTRRCCMLETCPDFMFNQGGGEYSYKDPETNKEKKIRMNTRKLGSTLMQAMLREVGDMCNPAIKSNWENHSHQQLVYDIKSKSTTFLFFSLSPEKLGEAERAHLEALGIEIPNVASLGTRETLDRYLSSALNLTVNKDGRLGAIDREKYVLTVDYAVKMLNVHERRMCGIPVIIEGETGVGKTALVRMLSILWNESTADSKRIATDRLLDILKKRQPGVTDFTTSEIEPEEVDAAFRVAEAINKGSLPEEEDIEVTCRAYQDILKVLLDDLDHSALEIMETDASTEDLVWEAKTAPSPILTARLLMKFLSGKPLQTFFKCSVHAALTPTNIKEFMKDKIELAKKIQKRHELRNGAGVSQVDPTVVVFFDEINTSSCMGLFKEIMVDHTLGGEPIPSNLFVVAACNPHRGSSTTISASPEREDWVLGSYYVRPLPPTLHFLRWDYGALDQCQENAYIQEKIRMDKGPLGLGISQISGIISESQKMIREFAQLQLEKVGFTSKEAEFRARSCVSQRDIQRVFALTEFFQRSYTKMPTASFPAASASDILPIRRAVMVAVGVVYYLRLDSTFRKEFCMRVDEVDKCMGGAKFLDILQKEIDIYINPMQLPPGIAKTNSLKENLFATVVCTMCRIPLIIVGAPGSSKTLSFNLAVANLKGVESKSSFFRNFYSLDPHHYQCSRRSTSLEIENVFKRAVNRQQNHEKSQLPVHCVVFMDEAGLPEERHESLKVLHYYLDDPQVSFVAITNHVLDAAKSNRAVNLFRPKTDLEDLQTLAKGCMHSENRNVPTALTNIMETVRKFCEAYLDLVEIEDLKNFFGLRDFIHFVRYLRRHLGQTTELSPNLVLNALERNLNGITRETFAVVANLFLSKMGQSLDKLKPRNIIEILKESLSEKSLSYSPDDDGAETEVRYKLIIDKSEDDSMARLLFHHGVLEKASTRIFSCSDFPGDDEMHKVHIISAIKHCALEGQTVILSHTDDINESFYDLFNQHFRRIDDPEHGRRYYSNIAIGSHSKPCRVDPSFQCIVHIRQAELENCPYPFLNRFEKFLVSQEDLLEISIQALSPHLRKIVALAKSRAMAFEETIGTKNLYGRKEQTLDSIILELLPVPGSDKRRRNLSDKSTPDIEYNSRNEDGGDDENTNDSSESDSEEEKDEEAFIAQEWESTQQKVMEKLEQVLQKKLGFSFPLKSEREQKVQATAVFSAAFKLLKSDERVKKKLIKNPFLIGSWLMESFTNTRSERDLFWSQKLCQAFAVACVVQWMIHHMCCHLLQIATPEAIILNGKALPEHYRMHYLDHQCHFSFKKLVIRTLSTNLAKVICFTRTHHEIQSLPLTYPNPTTSQTSFLHFLPSDVDFATCKLESMGTLDAFLFYLHAFLANDSARIFVVIANMAACSIPQINLVRTMVEEQQEIVPGKKAVVLLLHFPPSLDVTKPCYPSLFLHGWNHVYLDSVVQMREKSPIDVEQWIRVASSEKREHVSFQSSFLNALESFLPSSINLALSRVVFDAHSGPLHIFNRKMNASERSILLSDLLEKMPVFGQIICRKFSSYWTDEFIREQLTAAADSLREYRSALSIEDRILSRLKSLWDNYFAYLLYRLNIDSNLEILFGPEADQAIQNLFLKIFDAMPVPNIEEILVRNDTFDARQPRLNHRYAFPFFTLVAQIIDRKLDEILIDICLDQEKGNPLFGEESSNGQKPMSKKATVTLKETENKALDGLFQTLEEYREDSEDRDLKIAATAFSAIKENKYFWQCYLSDFARIKLSCNCKIGKPESTDNLMSTWIGDLGKCPDHYCIMSLHVAVRLRQKSIGQIVAALRPFDEALQSLVPAFKSESETSVKLEINDERLYTYVIQMMFDYLKNMLSAGAIPGETFVSWCVATKNLGALPSISAFHFSDSHLRPRLQCIHAVVALTSSMKYSIHGVQAGFDLARKIIATGDESRTTLLQSDCEVSSLDLTRVIEIALECLNGQSEETERFSLFKIFLSEILSFYFPPLPFLSMLACSLADCSTLLSIISNDRKFMLNADPLFKVFQDSLIQILSSSCGGVDDRTGFSVKIRFMVNKFLAQKRGLDEVVPYIPTCYPKSCQHIKEHQPLAVVYFHCCLTQFFSKFKKSSLVNVLLLHQSSDRDGSTKDVSFIERQALLQLIIAKFANVFDLSQWNVYCQIATVEVVEVINDIFTNESWGGGEDGGHKPSFLHHLFKQLHNMREMIKLFTDDYQAKCSSFSWMISIRDSFEQRPRIQAHLFPFMIPGRINEHCNATEMHRNLLPLVEDIAKSTPDDCQKAIGVLEVFCQEQVKESPGVKYKLRMSLWLHIYYSFYERKISSKEFSESIMNSFKCLELEHRQSRLVACFLDPEKMIFENEPAYYEGDSTDSDAIRELFYPQRRLRQDTSDLDLKRSLALLLGVSLGLPPCKTHLWSHLFCPEMIEKTLICGVLCKNVVEQDEFNCMCNAIDEEYGRTDGIEHPCRETLCFHSHYLLLWTSFAAFVVLLLSQPESKQLLKERVFSERLPLRNYCMRQLRKVWQLLQRKLNLSDEERILLITSSLHKFLEVGSQPKSGLRLATFKAQSEVDAYKQTFQADVFLPVISQFEDCKYLDEKIWQHHQPLSTVRLFGSRYPMDVTYEDFTRAIEYVKLAGDQTLANELKILVKFVTEKMKFKVGGLLLPDLIEFYQWLHGELSHLVTRDQAFKLEVGQVVSRLAGRYSATDANYIQRLYSRVKDKYNEFVELVQGCRSRATLRGIDLLPISDNSVLCTFLSDENGPDALFVAISELIDSQNKFVKMVSDCEEVAFNQTVIHPLEVDYHNCLLGDLSTQDLTEYLRNQNAGIPKETGAEFLRLIQKYHPYVPGVGITADSRLTKPNATTNLISKVNFRATSMFDFHSLQKAVIETFIAGKPIVENAGSIRKIFRYRTNARPRRGPDGLGSLSGLEASTDLISQISQLPEEFQMKMPEEQRKCLELAFHDLNFQRLTVVLKALRTVAGHISQIKIEDNETFTENCRKIMNDPIEIFLKQMYSSKDGKDVSFQLELNLLEPSQLQKLLNIPLRYFYDLADFYSKKLLRGEYEFSNLPLSLKTPLQESDVDAIMKLPEKLSERGVGGKDVKLKLREFEQMLRHAELNMKKQPQQTLRAFLTDNACLLADEFPVADLPETVRVEHYTSVRIVVRSLITKTLSQSDKILAKDDSSKSWIELALHLWKEFPFFRYAFRTEQESDIPLPVAPLTGEFFLWYERDLRDDDDDDDVGELADDRKQFPYQSDESVVHASQLLEFSSAREEEIGEESFDIIPDEAVRSLPKIVGTENVPIAGKELTIALPDDIMFVKALEGAIGSPEKLAEVLAKASADDQASFLKIMTTVAKPTDLRQMNVNDVGNFLRTIGKEKYAEKFLQEKIDGGRLMFLDGEALKELGVDAAVDRAVILDEIDKKKKAVGNF